jgi:poly-gamma-glutamate synthesis protein (capsule biosynthesis protein)
MQASPNTSRGRLRIIALLVTCVALLAVGVWATVIVDRSGKKGSSETPTQIRMTFVGDIMLDRDPGKAMLTGRDPFEGIADLLKDGDITVGNLECVVSDSGTRLPKKEYTFRADPKAIPYLARYFDALSLANNHTGDFGDAALVETMYRLRRANVPFFGAGLNEKEAHTPWVVEKNGIKVAVLGYNEFPPRSFEAGPRKPGLAWSVDEQVVADIKAVRSKVDLVMTFMHWGEEYIPKRNERQKALARTMIDAGADVVVGNHPHVTQGYDFYKGRLIVYCLGNFVFDEWVDPPNIMKDERRLGWVLQLKLTKSGLVEWNTVVTRTDDNGFPQKVRGAKGPGGKVASAGSESKAK